MVAAIIKRQDVERIRLWLKSVINPTKALGAILQEGEQCPVQADEDGDLQQHRQTAAQRIDFLVFIKLHHGLLLYRHAVIAVFLFDGLPFKVAADFLP